MLFLRSVKGCYKIGRIKIDDIWQELNIFTLKDKIKDIKVRWCQHLNRMPEDRLPVKANKYRPTGTQDIGRPRKRWVPVQDKEPNTWIGGGGGGGGRWGGEGEEEEEAAAAALIRLVKDNKIIYL
jgi:hypothetical protein